AEARSSATARPVDPPRQSPASFAAATEPAGAEHQQAQPSGPSPAAPSQPAANAAQTSGDQAASAAEGEGSNDIEEIKRAGLTGRQLSLARRVAQKHDLP
ncbi:capsule biosynthesis protein, partial [Tritonibacter sp. SIMBA_163]